MRKVFLFFFQLVDGHSFGRGPSRQIIKLGTCEGWISGTPIWNYSLGLFLHSHISIDKLNCHHWRLMQNNAYCKEPHPLYRTDAVFDGLQKFVNHQTLRQCLTVLQNIWLYGHFVYFHWPDALPGINSWYCWSALRPGDNTRFLSPPRRGGDQDPASSSP